MAQNSYRVDYHVTCVVYFDPDRALAGPDFARLWTGTGLYGRGPVVGAFWHEGRIPKSQERVDLASLTRIEALLSYGDMPIYGGGVCVNSRSVARDTIQDLDFYYAHNSVLRNFGFDTPPSLSYTISGQWLERAGSDAVLEHMKEHFEVADRYCPPYGLIELSRADDGYGGAAFSAAWVGNLPLHRWVEEVKWLHACSKRADQARSVYWGNYFGPAILDRLGGRDRFLDRLRRHAQYPDGKPSARVWEFPNGVFVSLCIDPLGCQPGKPLHGWASQNMQWLIRELGTHGALNPWAT